MNLSWRNSSNNGIDRRSKFTFALFQKIRRHHRSNHIKSRAYHPATYGLVEGFSPLIMVTSSWPSKISPTKIHLVLRNSAKKELWSISVQLFFNKSTRPQDVMNLDSVKGTKDFLHIFAPKTMFFNRYFQLHKPLKLHKETKGLSTERMNPSHVYD